MYTMKYNIRATQLDAPKALELGTIFAALFKKNKLNSRWVIGIGCAENAKSIKCYA